MLNDVSFPPLEGEESVSAAPKGVRMDRPVLPAEHPIVEVTLFDHPDFAASGAGNFWLLGMVGLLVLALVVLVGWVMLA